LNAALGFWLNGVAIPTRMRFPSPLTMVVSLIEAQNSAQYD
jgi:hypothetical protein